MKKIKRIVTLVLALVLIMATLAGCSSKDEGTIKVAVAGPQTGDYAEYGTGFKNAVELMAEEWNAKGGVLGKKLK